MSLTTDGLALGAAFAIAVGSALQARQAFTELNAETPFGTSVIPVIRLFLLTIAALFRVIIFPASALTTTLRLVNLGLLQTVTSELTPRDAAALTPRQAAVLTRDQADTLADKKPVTLTSDQRTALNNERAKDLKKWLGWFLGWFFIMIGAFVALIGTILTLVNDL
jgi:hypothetical protein